MRIAVIPGDGIGKEVMPEGLRVLDAVCTKFAIPWTYKYFPFASWDYYAQHNTMLPENWREILLDFDAIYLGATGWPAKIPDHISLWGSLFLFRREFDQYINLRPVRSMPGLPTSVVKKDGSRYLPREIDLCIVRENTEGEYSNIGGKMFAGTSREFVTQQSIMTRQGVDRTVKFAFELAKKRIKKHLTSATKSNGLAITMPYWDERVDILAALYPEVRTDKFHIDILTAHFVQRPDFFDVVVASNLFGDILSDLAPACTGTIGIAPSANINPERTFPSLFEPVHGSAPDIAGLGIANPIGQILSAALMLDFLNHKPAADCIEWAVESLMQPSSGAAKTPDLGGKQTTVEVGKDITSLIQNTVAPSAGANR